MICMLVEVHVKPLKIEQFLEVIRYDAVRSEGDEPGCIRFDVLRDNDDPLKFYFYEVYRDEAARQAHQQTPHYVKWSEFKENGFDREMVKHSTTNIYPTDDGWR